MKKMMMCTILLISSFFCVTSVYAGDMSGLGESIKIAAITYFIFFISLIAYSICLIKFCSKRKLKQTKKNKKELNQMKIWMNIFSCLLIILSLVTYITKASIIALIGIIIINNQHK